MLSVIRRKDGSLWFAGLCLLFTCMVVLRTAYLFLPLPSGDGGSYLWTASKLLKGGYFFSGGGGEFDLLYRTPGYPVFLALVYRLSENSIRAVVLLQHLIGVLSAFVVYRIGMRIWGRSAALLGALFAGLHFHFIYFESYPLSEALAVFLLSTAIYLAMALNSDRKAGLAAFGFGGLVLACGGLCRPEISGLAPLFAVYFWVGRGIPAAIKLRRIFAYLLPVVMLLGAWVLRNGVLFDYWGMTPNSQIAFFDGPAGMCVQAWKVKPDIVSTPALAHQYDYGRVNRAVFVLEKNGISYQWSARRIGAIALAAAAESPASYFKLSLLQLRDALFTGPTWPPSDLAETMPDIFTAAAGPVSGGILSMTACVDGILEGAFLAPLFLAGCLAAIFFRSKERLLLTAAIAYLLGIYAFLSPLGLRYRIVVEPFMGLMAAGAVSLACRWLAGGRSPTPGDVSENSSPGWLSGPWPVIVLAVSFCSWCWFMAELSTTYKARSLSFSPEATPLLRAAAAEPPDKEALISLGYLSLKRVIYPGALKYFDRALKLDPGNKAASDGRAAALFRMGLGQEALEELKRGRALHGDSPDLYYNIAMIEYLSGDAAGAIKDLSRFLKFREITPAFRAQALALRSDLAAHGRATGMGLQSVRH